MPARADTPHWDGLLRCWFTVKIIGKFNARLKHGMANDSNPDPLKSRDGKSKAEAVLNGRRHGAENTGAGDDGQVRGGCNATVFLAECLDYIHR